MSDIDQDTRLSVIRDICRKEGHGSLVEVTNRDDLPHGVLWCQRGCGAVLYRPAPGCTVEGFLDYLRLRNVTGTARFSDRSGFIEIEVER